MISRFRSIYRKFGMLALLRTLLLLFGLVGMAVLGIVMLGRFDAAVTAVVGLTLGAIFRRPIAERVELLTKVVPIGLFIYAIVIFLGKQFGLDNGMKLFIITLTTVVILDIQFWSLSDPGVYNPERE
ncbi:MAG: hypothetical protein ACYC0X_26580 [Pirellulaceae bacterium]